MGYKLVKVHVAIRMPDQTLIPVWNGQDAKQMIARMDCGGLPEIVIERMEMRGTVNDFEKAT